MTYDDVVKFYQDKTCPDCGGEVSHDVISEEEGILFFCLDMSCGFKCTATTETTAFIKAMGKPKSYISGRE